MKDIKSVYPVEIDDRIFIQDIDLNHLAIYNQFLQLLQNGQYTAASDLIANSDITSYGAWWLNYITDKEQKIMDEIKRRGVIRDNAIDAVKALAQTLKFTRLSNTYPNDPNLQMAYIWIQ